ncbi:MAG TPA: diguanylate cyclase [Anaerolineaceae bacterium]|nr:diguanylate cyclase [Anaerolineaceae bacterium]
MTVERLKELEERAAASPGGQDGVDVLNSLAWELRDQAPARARSLAERALELVRELEASGHPYVHGTAQAKITLGELDNNAGAYGAALTNLLEAYTLLQGQLFPDLLAVASHSIGWAHLRLGNYSEAIDFMNRALLFFRQSGLQEKEAAVLTSMGTVYSQQGMHSQAMENFKQALALQQFPAVNRGKGVTLNNLAYAQVMLGALQEAISNAQAGIEVFHAMALPSLEVRGLDTLARAYFAAGEYRKAEDTLQQCLTVTRQLNSEFFEMEVMLNLGKIYFQEGQLERAKEHYLESLKLADIRQSNFYRYKYHEILAKIFENLGQAKEALQQYKEFHISMETAVAEAASYRVENLKILHQVVKNQKEAEVLWLSNQALEREIDERQRERTELEKLATTDALTGLYNRRHLFTLGEYELEKSRRQEIPISMILLDIDDFKLVNDNFSHAIGDRVLIEIAKSLTRNARVGDICCRYGGEEFIILLPNTGLAAGQDVAERIRKVISATPLQIDGVEIRITASLGVAQVEPEDIDLASLIARADRAMYRAKSSGRDQAYGFAAD